MDWWGFATGWGIVGVISFITGFTFKVTPLMVAGMVVITILLLGIFMPRPIIA